MTKRSDLLAAWRLLLEEYAPELVLEDVEEERPRKKPLVPQLLPQTWREWPAYKLIEFIEVNEWGGTDPDRRMRMTARQITDWKEKFSGGSLSKYVFADLPNTGPQGAMKTFVDVYERWALREHKRLGVSS